jgi:signal transduction histidine kinase
MRHRFLRRVGIGFALFFGLMFAVSSLAFAVASRVFGLHHHRGFAPLAALLGVVLVLGLLSIGRSVRRMAIPIGEVMEAADRVASGDYTVRVDAQGPREMRRLARSFNEMTERLEAGETVRRNLLADLAHELRTPLSVIQGNTEGVLDGLYPPDRAHLAPVLEETKVMARLLDDLQTLATAEAGALRLHRELVDPASVVQDAVAPFRPRAKEAGVGLDVRVATALPSIDIDPVRVGEILANLLLNAVRHTPRDGSIEVSAKPADEGRAVAFSVADTGPGIPADVLPHVFDRFVKAADSGGAGLGLAIAKSLVEAHGGSIAAESTPRTGTRIRFVLPVHPAEQAD